MTSRETNFLLYNQTRRSFPDRSHHGYTSTTPPTKTWYSSTMFWISGRDSHSNNNTASIKHGVHWPWWGTFRERLKKMVRAGMIPNCSFTLYDINNDNTIFGPGVPSLKGKMVIRQPNPVVLNYINILKDILQLHNTVSVAADIIFVNRMTFLVIISRHVEFTIVQYLGKSTTVNISKSLDNINDVYYRRGMYVKQLYMDREFEKNIITMPGISNFNRTAAADNTPEIERQIRVIKESAISIWSNLQLDKIPGHFFH